MTCTGSPIKPAPGDAQVGAQEKVIGKFNPYTLFLVKPIPLKGILILKSSRGSWPISKKEVEDETIEGASMRSYPFLIDQAGVGESLRAVDKDERLYNESWLQELLRRDITQSC